MAWFGNSDGEGNDDPQQASSASPETTLVVASEERDKTDEDSIIALDRATSMLAAATDVDDVKDVRDKAEAVRKYAESAGLGLQALNDAAELKLRAERKVGEMILAMKLHGGSRGETTVTLDDLGITKDQSSRWQKMAKLPESLFERHVAEVRESGEELTTAGVLRLANQQRTKRKPKTGGDSDGDQPDAGVVETLGELVAGDQRFGCLYVDPPWPSGVETVMTVDQLAKLPIGKLAAESAHLHLWTPSPRLFDARQLIAAWGFAYAGVFVWTRPNGTRTDYWRDAHELLLLGVRGEAAFADKNVASWLSTGRPRGDRKPARIRTLLESVSPGPYCELFTSREAAGWTCCRVAEATAGDD